MLCVLDTNIVASAMLWGGKPLHLLQAGRDKRIDLFTSTRLLAELTDILGRRKFLKKIAASGFSVSVERGQDQHTPRFSWPAWLSSTSIID